MTDPLDDALNAVSSLARLDELWALDTLDPRKRVTRVRVHGRGGKAHVSVDLDNGEWIEFDPLGSYSSPARMNFEIAAQTGAKPKLKAPDVQEVVTLLYWLGDHRELVETADRAWELGAEYLREATLCDVHMGDQESRWHAFSQINGRSDRHDTVLHDVDTGSRYVRTQWFTDYLRARSDVGEAAKMRAELERRGWKKAGNEGRVKATDPSFPRTLQWAFLIVPRDWEQQ